LRNRKGFTLVELLVVIAILGILIAIIFPVFARAREKTRQSVCLNNQKQLGMGMQMYADDYDGCLPPAGVGDGGPGPSGNWAGVDTISGMCDPTKGAIYPYVKTKDVYLCPSVRNADLPCIDLAALPYPLSYSMNYLLSHVDADSRVTHPSTVGLLVHEDRKTINDGYFHSGAAIGITDKPSDVHNGGTCVLYCDMHVKWQCQNTIISAIEKGEWNPDLE
jgi:prepilin-type N-terminal cleavage/methylation domain-containing protein